MIRKTAPILLFVLMLAASFYIKSQIDAFNIDYYHSKDNGAFVQFQSVLVFSFLFFILISKRNRIIHGFIGILVGVISSIICYLLFVTEILFPISASVLVMILFYVLDYVSKIRHTKKAAENCNLK
jgi:hypothetical protein